MRILSAVALLSIASTALAQQPGPFGQPSGKGTFAAPQPEKARWEYAELYVRIVSAGFPGKEKDPDDRVRPTSTVKWTTDKAEVTYTSYADFAGKVKMDGFKEDATINQQRIQVLNHLGSEGWELVESTTSAPGAGTRTMLFKRRVR